MSSLQDLNGKVVVVTGAARGLGASLSRQLASRGAKIALVGLEPEELAIVAKEVGGSWWEADVTDSKALDAVAKEVIDTFGNVDIVVANAGIATGGTFLVADADSFDRVITVNLLGSVRTIRAFLPHVLESKGYILQIASAAALVPAPMLGAYCASKSGVEAFALSLRSELRSKGVDVGVAYLSWTDTDMVRGADEIEGLGGMRKGAPGLIGKTYPLEPAVANIVKGIEHRAPFVYAQGWLRILRFIHPILPSIIPLVVGKDVATAEKAVLLAGKDATKPVGAGGRADSSAKTRGS
jgi:NAD(P)-dependent dehydrogenase (short-subunit alcohol dehydrogenase family)